MDPIVLTICFGLGIGVVQIVVALSLIAARAGIPIGLLPKFAKSVGLNRQAVRSGEKSASDIISSKDFYKKKRESLSTKLERAGYDPKTLKRDFLKLTLICSLFGASFALFSAAANGSSNFLLPPILGSFVGALLPFVWLDRQIISRDLQITKDLPIILDQLQVNLSGSLSLMSSIDYYLESLKTRGTYNLAAFYFEKVILKIQTGSSPSDAFREVGEQTGHVFLSHVFNFLSSCEDHGTGVSGQLASLNDQATSLYQISIEEKIVRLPVAATFPLFLVFAGFFAMTSSGIVTKLISSFPVDP